MRKYSVIFPSSGYINLRHRWKNLSEPTSFHWWQVFGPAFSKYPKHGGLSLWKLEHQRVFFKLNRLTFNKVLLRQKSFPLKILLANLIKQSKLADSLVDNNHYDFPTTYAFWLPVSTPTIIFLRQCGVLEAPFLHIGKKQDGVQSCDRPTRRSLLLGSLNRNASWQSLSLAVRKTISYFFFFFFDIVVGYSPKLIADEPI